MNSYTTEQNRTAPVHKCLLITS